MVVAMVSLETRDLLYQFILDKEGAATKSDVVNYMQNLDDDKYRISRDTTFKLIDEMEFQGIILISKPERPGFAHYLSINSENQFNQINKSLVAVRSFINMSEEPIKKIVKLYFDHTSTHNGEPKKGCHDCKTLVDIISEFPQAYCAIVNDVLDRLLFWTNVKISDGVNRFTLYSEIIVEKNRLYHGVNELARDFPLYVGKLSKEEKEFTKKNGILIDALSIKLKETMKIFDEEFQSIWVKRKLV